MTTTVKKTKAVKTPAITIKVTKDNAESLMDYFEEQLGYLSVSDAEFAPQYDIYNAIKKAFK